MASGLKKEEEAGHDNHQRWCQLPVASCQLPVASQSRSKEREGKQSEGKACTGLRRSGCGYRGGEGETTHGSALHSDSDLALPRPALWVFSTRNVAWQKRDRAQRAGQPASRCQPLRPRLSPLPSPTLSLSLYLSALIRWTEPTKPKPRDARPSLASPLFSPLLCLGPNRSCTVHCTRKTRKQKASRHATQRRHTSAAAVG